MIIWTVDATTTRCTVALVMTTIVAGGGSDSAFGEAGNDTLIAGTALIGSEAGTENILDGSDGNDLLYGDQGPDTAIGDRVMIASKPTPGTIRSTRNRQRCDL